MSVRYSSQFQQNVCICKITSSEWCTHYLAFLFRDLLLNLSYKNEYINFCSMKSICFQTNGFRVVETFQLPSSRKTLTLCNLLETFSGFQQVIFPNQYIYMNIETLNLVHFPPTLLSNTVLHKGQMSLP